MSLRKCPSCHDLVGADSGICPRCGVTFRAVQIRRAVILVMTAGLVTWLVIHMISKPS
jgi:RNA polymerase subunit RPABC4/transcription elongation factor Spt4